jgi:hypothetical protein
MGAVGGVLGGGEGTDGAGEGGWIGLRTLEVGFQDSSAKQSRRDEVRFNVFFFDFYPEFPFSHVYVLSGCLYLILIITFFSLLMVFLGSLQSFANFITTL